MTFRPSEAMYHEPFHFRMKSWRAVVPISSAMAVSAMAVSAKAASGGGL